MTLFEELEQRRKALKMSRPLLAKRSRVSLPTVNRILLDRNSNASFAHVVAVAKALGMNVTAEETAKPDEFRDQQAARKATRLVRLVQGTSALEGQGLNSRDLKVLVSRTTKELLASRSKLWSE